MGRITRRGCEDHVRIRYDNGSAHEVATLAKEISGNQAEIRGAATSPKQQIICDKIHTLGREFGGKTRLRQTVAELVDAVRRKP